MDVRVSSRGEPVPDRAARRCGCRQSGYALLAAVAIGALAGILAAAALAAVSARESVVQSDRAAEQASSEAQAGLRRACRSLRQGAPVVGGSIVSSRAAAPDGHWSATLTSASSAVGGAWATVGIDVSASAGRARQRLRAVAELRAQPPAQGVAVAGDVTLGAPLSISGSGLYSGGSVRGREWVTFAPSVSGAAGPDHVHGESWPVAGVHALGGIWAHGSEVHEVDDGPYPADTDTHTTSAEPLPDLRPPDAAALAALQEDALPAGAALENDVLDLALLPDEPPCRDPAPSFGGYVVVLERAIGARVRVVGRRAASACPVTLVLASDAEFGAQGAPVKLSGAIVGLGAVTIAGDTQLNGHLYARGLSIDAPFSVDVPVSWRLRPAPGLALPVLVSLYGL